MGLRSLWARLAVAAGLSLALAACGAPATPPGQSGHATIAPPKIAYANIGGYLLAYECGMARVRLSCAAGRAWRQRGLSRNSLPVNRIDAKLR